MDHSRKDAPTFDLSAQTSEDEDILQVGADDLSLVSAEKKKPEPKNAPRNPASDALLFNALVSSVAPVHTTGSSALPPSNPPEPVAAPHEPIFEPFNSEDDTRFQPLISSPLPPSSNRVETPISDVPMLHERTGAWWTLPLMCLGLAIVACAVLVPAADENRRDAHELARIGRDVAHFEKQSEVNKQFLEHVSTDPTLAERLAMRQLRLTRADSRIVRSPVANDPFAMSPYALVSIDPPKPMPEYRPIGGFLSRYFLDPQGQIYLTGMGILMTAAGVILGGGAPRRAG